MSSAPVSTIVLMKENEKLADLVLGRSRVRRRILEVLLARPGSRLHLRGIGRLVATSPGTAARELQRLVAAGLVERRREGNQLLFSAVTDSPAVQAVRMVLLGGAEQPAPRRLAETAAEYGSAVAVPGLSEVAVRGAPTPQRGPDPLGLEVAHRLKAALRRIYGPRLRGVYLYGSRARGDWALDSDVDVLVVLDRVARYGEELERTSEAVAELSLDCGVSVSPVFVPQEAWRGLSTPFLASVSRQAIPA
jgi:predicted nucleotidyltransferase/DNA-binding transcriptional ArsR family regulator